MRTFERKMMRHLFLVSALLFISPLAFAQPGYADYKQQEGIKIGTKWSTAKDSSGTKKPALLLALENKNDQAASFDIAIRFYYEGILREQSTIPTQCLPSKKSMIGKLNGLYIMPAQFTQDQLKNSDFSFELDLENVELMEECVVEE